MKEPELTFESDQPRRGLGRRHFIAIAGASAAAAALLDSAMGSASTAFANSSQLSTRLFGNSGSPDVIHRPGIVTRVDEGFKPIYLPETGSRDPAVLSLAENLFWNDIMMEHALFMELHMPGPDLESHRREAQEFQRKFRHQFSLAAAENFDRENYIEFNRSTVTMLMPLITFKRRLQAAQASGEIRSLAWPSFFDHVAEEAERFKARLERLSQGDVDVVAEDETRFWRDTMGEHAGFIAHLLDPTEKELVAQAKGFEERFAALDSSDLSGILVATRAIIPFKTQGARGIARAEIASVIHPALADHVRREAVKGADDLSRLN